MGNCGREVSYSDAKRSSCTLVLYRNDMPIEFYIQTVIYQEYEGEPRMAEIQITSKGSEFLMICDAEEIASLLPDYIIEEEIQKRRLEK